MQAICGRERELEILNKLYQAERPEFLVVYGRRRVGKTYLINQYFKDKGIFFELAGVHRVSTREQLKNFAREVSGTFLAGRPLDEQPKTWMDAFFALNTELEKIDQDKKIILFFDELPWLDSRKSGFLPALDHFWNRYASRRNNLILIACGSAASWMINKILDHRGGLHGRITQQIRLLPFTLKETQTFLQARQIQFDKKQLIELYMALGGVAKYLTYIEPGKSVAQLINALCFEHNGPLFNEFNKLYHSLFDRAEKHIRIVKVLAQHRQGLEQAQLLNVAKIGTGGTATKVLNELVESGFISVTSAFMKKKKEAIYRLIDEYSLFYLKWIDGLQLQQQYMIDTDYWIKQQAKPTWSIWAGYAFENICFKHIFAIKQALGISGITTYESSWCYRPDSKDEKGAQIDLLIDRADQCINLCELKFYNQEFTIKKQYAEELENKKRVFKEVTETRKTVFMTLITAYGATRNEHYLATVDNQLTLDDFFKDL